MDQAVKRRMAVARLVALLAPAILLGGALLSQYVGELSPCEMCYWQRWPHAAAIAFALLAVLFRGGLGGRLLLILAALAIAVSGGIGIFHAGVEYGWRSEEHTSELQSLMRISYAVFCLTKKKANT